MIAADMASRTQQALAWLAAGPKPGGKKKNPRTPYAAAKRFNLSTSVVYRAISAQARALSRRRRVCPTCGHPLKREQS
jgi:hypothetical protein